MKIELKDKKGFTTVDLSIALIIILIFVVIMTSISYSVFTSSKEAKRTAVALNFAVDILENVGVMSFGEVTASEELFAVSSLSEFTYSGATTVSSNESIATGKIGTYEITVDINDPKGDNIVKIVTVTVTYPVTDSKTETVEIQRLKTIE